MLIILVLLSSILFASEQSEVITGKIAENFLKTKNISYTISDNFRVYNNKKIVAAIVGAISAHEANK